MTNPDALRTAVSAAIETFPGMLHSEKITAVIEAVREGVGYVGRRKPTDGKRYDTDRSSFIRSRAFSGSGC